ncbi:hypothetical protein J7355_00775 [Endozoicomonas sp. G2_2]|uniref:hypothetical protein n=1 Tax=Gammaproteobacteria TaxID=1236 RepID=UPI001ADD357C|nr:MULTISPECIES: hypothetical protein [Gammaproteobacteria]MBO9468621.1 hypothetical protein [Endozoicomonas sp. G2_2]|tara:strand:- start:4 stop:582 length:579 start_codon:yes stop_codon:yes gene_type:complete
MKQRLHWAYATFTLMALCAAPFAAAAQSVSIGGTTLDLGATRADTLAIANAHFNIVPAQVDGQYMLFPKRGPVIVGRDTYGKPLGTITIRDNQLTRISRNLGSFRSEDGEVAIERLISAFSRAPNDGDTPAVRTDAGQSGDASTSRVYFSYPDRAIQIVLFRPTNRSGLATIDITEQYALRPGNGNAGDGRR